jgi:transposase
MTTMDARSLGANALYELRRQVVRLHELGHCRTAIAAATKLSYSAVRKIIARYEQGGLQAIALGRRGRPLGTLRRLQFTQENRILLKMAHALPDQLGFDAAVWSSDQLACLIERECGITLPLRSVVRYRDRWALGPPSVPQRLAARVATLAQHDSQREALAQDGAAVLLSCHIRAWVPPAPLQASPNAVLLQAVSSKRRLHWMVVQGTPGADQMIRFIQGLIRAYGRMLHVMLPEVLWDGAQFAQWLEANSALVRRLPG